MLPLVFARSHPVCPRSGSPIPLGTVMTFRGRCIARGDGGGQVVEANDYGCLIVTLVLALFALTLLMPEQSDRH